MTVGEIAHEKSLSETLTAPWRRAYEWIVGQDDLDLVLRLSVLLHLVFPEQSWYGHMVMVGLCAAAVIYLPLMRNPWFWLFLGGYRLFLTIAIDWSTANNSSYVISYWCFALGGSLFLPDARKSVAVNAKALIALVFLFATAWKLTSREYLDGSMFHYLLYSDNRFFVLTRPFGGLHEAVLLENSRAVREMLRLQPTIAIPYEPAMYWLAQFLTWWTLAFEAVLAVLFLWRDGPVVRKWRNVLLLVFIATTYPPTKLIVFAWTMSILGFAQSPHDFKRTRFCYLLMLVGTLLFLGGDVERMLFGLLD